MRFVFVIHADPDRAAEWLAMTPEQREPLDRALHAWFEEHSAAGRILGGEEFAWPRTTISVGPGRDARDDTGAIPTGTMAVQVATEDEAVAMASTWPDLRGPLDRIDIIPVRGYEE